MVRLACMLPLTNALFLLKRAARHTPCNRRDDDVVPVCVVDTLLGGGSSFSAGGPGKGMYSRLYREVLNAYAWVESANAFSVSCVRCTVCCWPLARECALDDYHLAYYYRRPSCTTAVSSVSTARHHQSTLAPLLR